MSQPVHLPAAPLPLRSIVYKHSVSRLNLASRVFAPCRSFAKKSYSRWSPRAVKWALAFDPVSSHHLLFGSRGLVAMYQGWNAHCSICMRGESAGEPLLRCKAGLPPSDQLLLKRCPHLSMNSSIDLGLLQQTRAEHLHVHACALRFLTTRAAGARMSAVGKR